MKLTPPSEDFEAYLRDRLRAVAADRDLTRSARTAAIKELVDATVQFIALHQLMSVQPDLGKPHRMATEEEIRERVVCCVDGVALERFVADMEDRGADYERAGDAGAYAGYGNIERWGMTYAESIKAAKTLDIAYNPILDLDS